MPYVVDTTNPTYQQLLTAHTIIKNQLRDNYRPIMERMTKQQIQYLLNHDPLLYQVFQVSRAVMAFAGEVDEA